MSTYSVTADSVTISARTASPIDACIKPADTVEGVSDTELAARLATLLWNRVPDALLVAMSDVRQSAWWTRVLAEPAEARGVFVTLRGEYGVCGFDKIGELWGERNGLAWLRKTGDERSGNIPNQFRNSKPSGCRNFR